MIEDLFGRALCGFARLLTGVRALWRGSRPEATRRVYYANHRSHGDFVLIWAVLPPALRRSTRPVAAADYWLCGRFRQWLIQRVFRGVLVDRRPSREGPDPVDQMAEVLRGGESLILFPEGTRNTGEELLPFKSGIFHLARTIPDVEFVPVWIENLGRVMPKGTLIPVPLLCTLSFGAGVHLREGESKAEFVARARDALLDLTPDAA